MTPLSSSPQVSGTTIWHPEKISNLTLKNYLINPMICYSGTCLLTEHLEYFMVPYDCMELIPQRNVILSIVTVEGENFIVFI